MTMKLPRLHLSSAFFAMIVASLLLWINITPHPEVKFQQDPLQEIARLANKKGGVTKQEALRILDLAESAGLGSVLGHSIPAQDELDFVDAKFINPGEFGPLATGRNVRNIRLESIYINAEGEETPCVGELRYITGLTFYSNRIENFGWLEITYGNQAGPHDPIWHLRKAYPVPEKREKGTSVAQNIVVILQAAKESAQIAPDRGWPWSYVPESFQEPYYIGAILKNAGVALLILLVATAFFEVLISRAKR